jgi:hypothetical protein
MATIPAPGTSSQSTLSDWAGGYVTDMLGKAQAISDQPYQVYQGPMTAGQSNLQSKVFQGLGGLNFPSNLGQSFSSGMGGMGGMQQPPPFNPATMQSNLLGAPTAMPNYGTGTPQKPKTEADWNQYSSMALYAPGTDMAKAKADFLAGSSNNMPNMGDMGGMSSTGGATMPPAGAAPGSPEFNSWLASQKGTGVPQGMPSQGIAGLQQPQTSQQPSNIAQSYMNPFLQSVLDPQLAELRRQNDITNMNANARYAGQGAFGGGRQAVMNAENNRNLMQEMNKTVGQGYSNAYDKAMGQFNTEQGQSKDLVNLLSTAGATERGIEQEGITADLNEFNTQRDYPTKQVQFLQSMLQGLPISTVSTSPASQTGLGSLQSTVGTLGSTYDLLKKLGLT